MKKHLVSLGACILFLVCGLAVGFAAPRVSGWLKPSYVEGDYSAYLNSANSPVVLYGTSWCPYCAKTKAYFVEHHISYREMDIEKSPVAKQQYVRLGGGSIPKVLIGNRMIVGFMPNAFETALRKAGQAR